MKRDGPTNPIEIQKNNLIYSVTRVVFYFNLINYGLNYNVIWLRLTRNNCSRIANVMIFKKARNFSRWYVINNKDFLLILIIRPFFFIDHHFFSKRGT